MKLLCVSLIVFNLLNLVSSKEASEVYDNGGLRSKISLHGRKANAENTQASFECEFHADPVPNHHTLGQNDLNHFSSIMEESFLEFGLAGGGAFNVLDQSIDTFDETEGTRNRELYDYYGGLYGAILLYYCTDCWADDSDHGRRLDDPTAYEGIADYLLDVLHANNIKYFSDSTCATISCGSYFTDSSAGCAV